MSSTLARDIDRVRIKASNQLDPEKRASLGQYLTPSGIADFMASLFKRWPKKISLLDPGAGVGSLSEAFFKQWASRAEKGTSLDISAIEIDEQLLPFLKANLEGLIGSANAAGLSVDIDLRDRDFIADATFVLGFGGPRFSHAILNPPYKKIDGLSLRRKQLRKVGIEAVNLYVAFLALAIALTEDAGEIVAIVPRSFCNGTYFRPFREWLLERAAIRQIHIFESRTHAFRDDKVLQENIVIHLARSESQGNVIVSSSRDSDFHDYVERSLPFSQIVRPEDKELFIHVPSLDANCSSLFAYSLAEIGLSVSTGPVVDFRLRRHLHADPAAGAVPLLYSHHFAKGILNWPKEHRKPNSIAINDETKRWLIPQGWYVLTKRFSSKEEKKRIVSFVLDPSLLPFELYGIENHLNFIHQNKAGLDPDVARGLAVFLNSTLIDQHFRTFSGHTQVNATDLRNMKFPSLATLTRLGCWAKKQDDLTQDMIDQHIGSLDG